MQGAGLVGDAHEVVITKGEHRVDDVMADALVAQMDFETVGKEGEEVGGHHAGIGDSRQRSRNHTRFQIRVFTLRIVPPDNQLATFIHTTDARDQMVLQEL